MNKLLFLLACLSVFVSVDSYAVLVPYPYPVTMTVTVGPSESTSCGNGTGINNTTTNETSTEAIPSEIYSESIPSATCTGMNNTMSNEPTPFPTPMPTPMLRISRRQIPSELRSSILGVATALVADLSIPIPSTQMAEVSSFIMNEPIPTEAIQSIRSVISEVSNATITCSISANITGNPTVSGTTISTATHLKKREIDPSLQSSINAIIQAITGNSFIPTETLQPLLSRVINSPLPTQDINSIYTRLSDATIDPDLVNTVDSIVVGILATMQDIPTGELEYVGSLIEATGTPSSC